MAAPNPGRYPKRVADDRSRRELTILNTIAEALNSAPDAQQALERTLVAVTDLLGLHTGWIWLVDHDTGQFYNAASLNLPPYLQEPVRMTGRPCWCIEEFQSGELTPKNIDVLECSRLRPAVKAGAVEKTHGLAYHASIPLSFQDRPLGILNVTGPAWRKLTADELRLLSTIAYQVGIAIERARLAEERTRLARAEERTRIARDIHDTLAQGLTAIALHLEGAITQLERSPERARQRIERALSVARQNLEDARRSVLNLRAAPLEGRPLAEALGALGRTFTSETGVRVHVRATVDRTLPLHVESELYRIAQEALANVRRHADARAVHITLQPGRGTGVRRTQTRGTGVHGTRRVRLTIRDDGRGFDANTAPAGRHGILGMEERARLLGGRLRLESGPGRGTTVVASVPVTEGAS